MTQPPIESASIAAFPGAQGYGTSIIHARSPDSQVVFVTTTAATGPGSLKAAFDAAGPRFIIFRTGGVIDLSSLPNQELIISEPNVYVAGQTAPGDGICLTGGSLRIRTHEVVLRHLRFRPGDAAPYDTPDDVDGITIDGKGESYNIVIDHCSVSWAIDENVSGWWDSRDVTLQYNIISEALRVSQHSKGQHSMGVLFGDLAERISIHHNLFAHNDGRNPFQKSRIDGAPFDVINNIMYNCGTTCAQFDEYGVINLIANVFVNGPDTNYHASNPDRPVRLYGSFAGEVFLSGNHFAPVLVDPSADNFVLVEDMGSQGRLELTRDSAFAGPKIDVVSAASLIVTLASDLGATMPKRDAIDARVIQETLAGTGQQLDSATLGDTYASGTPYADADADGMDDAWEVARGLDPTSAADANRDPDANGYSNLEEFLSELAGDAVPW